MRKCSIADCVRLHLAKGFCKLHYYREYKRLHPEREKSYRSSYERSPLGKLARHRYEQTTKGRFAAHTREARRRGLRNDLSFDEYVKVTAQSCAYCGGFSTSKDHCGIDRLDSSLGYTRVNSVPCCRTCNTIKMDLSLEEFKTHVAKIYHHMFEQCQFPSDPSTAFTHPAS